MKVLILFNDEYGRRIADFIESRDVFRVEKEFFDVKIPPIVDDPSKFMPNLPKTDLLLFLVQDSGSVQLLPDIVKSSGAKSVIVAVDRTGWLPHGLQLQVENALVRLKVAYVFARPFCFLERMGDDLIDKFALLFGLPEVEIELEDGKVKEMQVLRCAPCGSTYFIAEELVGVEKEKAVEKAGLLFSNYPCMASMTQDKMVNDTLMHVAGYRLKNVVEAALEDRE